MGKGWWAHALVITIIASLVAVHHASLKQKKPTKVRGFIATEFVTILLVPMDSKPNFNCFGQMKWMLPVHTSWPCHFSEEVSTYHHFQHVFLPSWKVSQFAVLYQGPTKGNTHNFVDISVCFWQVFRCFQGPRCIIRLLKVLQKVFHRTQRLLQGECFSSTRLFFVRISDLFLLPAFHFFSYFPIPFTSPSNHHHRQTIRSSMPPSRRWAS